MPIKRLCLAASACLLLSATCNAASQPAQGMIGFQGKISESGCNTAVSARSVIELSHCPGGSRGNTFEVTSVRAVGDTVGGSPVSLHLTQEHNGASGYYDQQYVMVDRRGNAVTSGLYVVTVSAP